MSRTVAIFLVPVANIAELEKRLKRDFEGAMMRHAGCIFILLTVAVLAPGQSQQHTTDDFQNLVYLFDYDAKQPLDTSLGIRSVHRYFEQSFCGPV